MTPELAETIRRYQTQLGETQPPECTVRMRYWPWPNLDTGYDLEFPLSELAHAIALCGWTQAAHITNRSTPVLAEIARLEKLPYLEIPDGRRWFKMFGTPIQRPDCRKSDRA